ncbi:hypothetical protein KP509_36G038900 [Ceratopteris richardii]|uniref:Uncharacterized protein n=1 Tax=Ceratopteris richardii TaxID=49495 RepID=A0A8T2QBT3_CERRI|nr:hypothetical protein KP509_36G038900 [Ceratopteris richardii]
MYGAAIWGPGLATSSWTTLERPQILMIARLIRCKSLVPHDIIRAELAAPPMLVEALFQTVCLLHRIQSMDTERITYRAFQASHDMALAGDTSSWYAQTRDWLALHGFDIDRLPPVQYDSQAPTYSLSHRERNRIIPQEIWHTYIQRTWMNPGRTLTPKMLHYREHFLRISDQGFIETPRYMQTYLSHHLRVIIGQLRVSSHQLEIERGRARGVPREERWCPVCHTEIKSEEHLVIRCPAYSRMGRFLMAAYERRDQMLEPTHQTWVSTQQTITQYFERVGPHRTDPPPRGIGLTLQQAAAQRVRRRPHLVGYRRPRLHQEDISRIRIAHDYMMEYRRTTTTWTGFLQEALLPPPMYHILHPPPPIIST